VVFAGYAGEGACGARAAEGARDYGKRAGRHNCGGAGKSAAGCDACVARVGRKAHPGPQVSGRTPDLGIDPGSVGCQHFEASQLMLYRRVIDPAGYLILWQVGVAGDQSLARFKTGAAHRRLLVELLSQTYPLKHEIIVYKAATLPTQHPIIERLALGALPDVEVDMHMTVVIPPATAMQPNPEVRARLAAIDQAAGNA